MRIPALFAALVAVIVLPALPAAAQGPLDDPRFTEWDVPWEGARPRDPAVAPDGKVFFCGQGNEPYIGMFDPASGEFKKYDTHGTSPHNLLVAPDGMVWYAGNGGSPRRHIGKLDPATGEIERFEMPDERAQDPHTLIWDSQGDIWFTVQGGNFIGKLDTGSGEVRLVEALRNESGARGGGSRPYGIVMDTQDRPWVALFNSNHIATVDESTFTLKTFELPENARPRRIAITSDDIVWYGDWVRGTLGRLDPETGAVEEFTLPSATDARPYAMIADDSDRIWVVETGPRPNNVVGFDPMTNEIFSVTQPESGAGTIRHVFFDPETNSIWFGADVGTVGQMMLPPRRRAISQ